MDLRRCCKALGIRLRRFLGDEGAGGDAQAVVEFAIAFPLQLFITFGIMQIILLYISTLMVNFAAFRACRAAVVGEDPRAAAQIVLAPLAGTHIDPDDRDASPDVTIPGWGELYHADIAHAKTLAYEVEYEEEEKKKDLTVIVEFDQELMFPIVDRLFAVFFQRDDFADDEAVFGRVDGLIGSGAYRDRDPAYDPETKRLKEGRGYIREIGGAYHFLVVRQSTLYRQHAANYAKGGEIDIGKPVVPVP